VPSSLAAARRLRVLYDLGRAIAALDAPDELAGRMLDTILEVLGCQRGLVGLHDGAGGLRRVARPVGDELVVARAHLEKLTVRRESLLLREAGASAMGAPLVGGGRVLGFVYLDDRARSDRFTGDDLEFLTALAQLLASGLAQAEKHGRALRVAAALREADPREMLGASPPMQRLRELARKYALAGGAPVLIRGESGTGKELVAQLMHALSPRAEEPFVAVNCAAIPDSLLESELFGHEKGAFSGAARTRPGRFALAHRGTLFLDEVGDLSLPSQAKVLRALEEGRVLPLGADDTVEADVRILSATHKSLEDEIAAGRFREDLYYRLRVGDLLVPPLRERGEDIVLLARAFLERAGRRLGKRGLELGAEAVARARAFAWPGNVRQLKNEIERAAILCDGGAVELDDLGGGAPRPSAGADLAASWLKVQDDRLTLDDSERRLIEAALSKHGGVIARAARELGVPRTGLISRIQTLGIDVPAG
jgi:Nif-specific regulatory protein